MCQPLPQNTTNRLVSLPVSIKKTALSGGEEYPPQRNSKAIPAPNAVSLIILLFVVLENIFKVF